MVELIMTLFCRILRDGWAIGRSGMQSTSEASQYDDDDDEATKQRSEGIQSIGIWRWTIEIYTPARICAFRASMRRRMDLKERRFVI